MEPVAFNAGVRLDRHGGKYPTVGLNNGGTVVAMHNSLMGNAMWYWVGRLEDEKAKLNISWADGHHFDYGLYPCVALNDCGVVVEVHRSQWRQELRYRVGAVEGDLIQWGESSEYGKGSDPSIALDNEDRVVAVHVSSEGTLYCMLGHVNSSMKSIDWEGPTKFGPGAMPHVAINDKNAVIVVYQSPPSETHCSVWCQVGFASNKSIIWGRSVEYESGLCATVSLNNSDIVLIARQGHRLDEVLYGIGRIDRDTRELVRLENASQCKLARCKSSGAKFFIHPSVSMSDRSAVVLIYASNDSSGRAVWYHTGVSQLETGASPPQSYVDSNDEEYLNSPSDEC